MRKSSKIISLIRKGHPSYTGVSCDNKNYYVVEKNAHYIVKLKINDPETLKGVPYSIISKENEEKIISSIVVKGNILSEFWLTNEKNKINDIITTILKAYLSEKYSGLSPDIITIIKLIEILRMGNESLHFYCFDDCSIVILNHYDLFVKVAGVKVSEVKEYEN